MKRIIYFISLSLLLTSFYSCEAIFGRKEDATTEEIFEEGRIDPNLIPQNVGFVPIQPIWEGFFAPTDVYVGYDEMVYVVDQEGVHVLDQTGQEHRLIEIPGATKIVQDRRIHTYVTGTVDREIDGEMKTLSAIYRISNTAGGGTIIYHDTLIHPFSDASRRNTSFRNDDLEVKFTGVTVMHDNTIYVSRTGPRNEVSSTSRPDNAVLLFDENGRDIGYARNLNPRTSSLKSCLGLSGIANEVGPPQKIFGMSETRDFLITQTSNFGPEPEFGVLYIRVIRDPELGLVYSEAPSFTEFDYSKARRFLYEPYRFGRLEDIYVAPERRHIYVVDSEKDSLFQFTISGEEGVIPPANSNESRNIIVSFGGTGDGPLQFDDPSGLCYFEEMIYVADKNNNRIMRFRLNTDIE